MSWFIEFGSANAMDNALMPWAVLSEKFWGVLAGGLAIRGLESDKFVEIKSAENELPLTWISVAAAPPFQFDVSVSAPGYCERLIRSIRAVSDWTETPEISVLE